jgi:hypothetical protein
MRAGRSSTKQGKETRIMDVSVIDLWLAILLATVGVFIVSSIVHMALPHHKADWKKLPNEDSFLEAVRSGSVKAGQYFFPWCDMHNMKDPEVKKRYEAGPHGTVVVWAGMPNFPKNLVLQFIFFLVVSFCVAYVGTLALSGRPGVEYMQVFRLTATVSILSYTLASIPGTIWFGHSWRSQFMYILDGIAYALVTAGFFAWLWPKVEAAAPALPTVGG